ncbi:MAG: hypothetical protein N2378_16015 [Chloroflexaceae bacterium]|nr:hypothetical protein [Chloroflexaceae bacterium]
MTLLMLFFGLFWLWVLARLLATGPVASQGDGTAVGKSGAGRLALVALAGGMCGLVVWSLALIGPRTTLLIASGEFGWLPYVTRYPFQMMLAGALLGLVLAVSLQRRPGWPALSLRVAGVLVLGWAGYGLMLAQPPWGDLPAAVVLAHRGVAALGSAALTIAIMDLLLHPARLLERAALLMLSIQLVLLAQTMVWDELLARALGLPVR